MTPKTFETARDEAADKRFDESDIGDGKSCLYGFKIGADWARAYMQKKLDAALMREDRLVELVNKQAEDYGLWFIDGNGPEKYLQLALRKLHALIEENKALREGEK